MVTRHQTYQVDVLSGSGEECRTPPASSRLLDLGCINLLTEILTVNGIIITDTIIDDTIADADTMLTSLLRHHYSHHC